MTVDERMNEFVAWVATLDWRDREKVMDRIKDAMCTYCGAEPGCHCWNDE